MQCRLALGAVLGYTHQYVYFMSRHSEPKSRMPYSLDSAGNLGSAHKLHHHKLSPQCPPLIISPTLPTSPIPTNSPNMADVSAVRGEHSQQTVQQNFPTISGASSEGCWGELLHNIPRICPPRSKVVRPSVPPSTLHAGQLLVDPLASCGVVVGLRCAWNKVKSPVA